MPSLSAIPSLSASQQEIEDREKPESALDDLFSKDVEKEAVYDPSTLRTVSVTDKYQDPGQVDTSQAANYDIEPLTEPTKQDPSDGKERNASFRYITKNLEGDLKQLKNLRLDVEEDIKNNRQNTFHFKKRSQSIEKLEEKIKKYIGKYVNPISGDIAIGDEGYKKSVIKRLSKKFGKDLYPLLASLSNVQRI